MVKDAMVSLWRSQDSTKTADFVCSGFFIAPACVLTAGHAHNEKPLWVRPQADGASSFPITSVARHPNLDVALVKIEVMPAGAISLSPYLDKNLPPALSLQGYFEGALEARRDVRALSFDADNRQYRLDNKQPKGQSGGALCVAEKVWGMAIRHYADSNIHRGCGLAVHQFWDWLCPLLPDLYATSTCKVDTGATQGAGRTDDQGSIKQSYEPIVHPRVVQLAWSRSGSKLASASLDGTVRVWDLKDGHCTCMYVLFQGFSAIEGGGISCLAWASKDTEIFAGTTNGRVVSSELRSRRAASGKLGEPRMWSELASERSVDWITSLAVSPDGDRLASGSEDQNVRIWDISGREPKLEAVLDGPFGDVLALAWCRDEKVLFCADSNGRILKWNQSELKTPNLAADLVATWDEAEIVEHIAFSPDARTIGMVSWNKEIRIGTIDSGHAIVFGAVFDVPLQPLCLSFSEDGQFFASLSIDGKITLWKTEPRQQLSELDLGVDLSASRPHTLAYHPAKPLLASAGRRAEEVSIWDMAVGCHDSQH